MRKTKKITTSISLISILFCVYTESSFAQEAMPPMPMPTQSETTGVQQPVGGTTTIVSTPVSVTASSTIPRRIKTTLTVKSAFSKINDVTQDKRNTLETLPIGKTTFLMLEDLLTASAQTEILIGKVDAFLEKKSESGTDTTILDTKLEQSKSALNAANISISALSSFIETWVKETSTSTYKKAVQTKKLEFRASADTARKNIKKANGLLREIVTTLAPSAAVVIPDNPGVLPVMPPILSSSTTNPTIPSTTTKITIMEQ